MRKKKSCQICSDKHYARGFCEKHYRRWIKHLKQDGKPHWKSYLDLNTCLWCSKPKYAKGLCKNHYYIWKRAVEGRSAHQLAWYAPDLNDYGEVI